MRTSRGVRLRPRKAANSRVAAIRNPAGTGTESRISPGRHLEDRRVGPKEHAELKAEAQGQGELLW
jgi:hypothetical protein